MDYFTLASNFTLSASIEGGYVSPEAAMAKGDPGGETNMGLCHRDFPELDLKNLTREKALEVYRDAYWSSFGIQKAFCDLMPWPLNISHFDACVNIGNARRENGEWIWHGNSTRILQRALDIVADGLPGPVTTSRAHQATRSQAMGQIRQRRQFYRSLAQGNPARYAHFLDGWLARCDQLIQYINLHDNEVGGET